MKTKTLKNGFSMPVFGMGSWMMGGATDRDANNDGVTDIASLKRGLDAGLTHIDTAEYYSDTYAEELVGKALEGYDREKLFLASKVWQSNLAYEDVIRSCKASLKRLGTKYLDLYFIHKPNDDIPLSQTMRALDTLVDDGLIKNIGISNFTLERTKEAVALSRHGIAATQVHYNLTVREAERTGLLDYCQTEDVMLIAWRPLQKGLLEGADAPIVTELCTKYNCTFHQLALAWLVSQKNVVTLSTMRNELHLKENISALEIEMTESDVVRLVKEFPIQLDKSDCVELM